MAKVTMKDACQLLSIEQYEIFAIKGHGHDGHVWKGTEFKFFFTENNLFRILFESDRTKVIKYGDIRGCCLACEVFHGLFAGMLTVVRAVPQKRQYVYGYGPEDDFEEQNVDELSLF